MLDKSQLGQDEKEMRHSQRAVTGSQLSVEVLKRTRRSQFSKNSRRKTELTALHVINNMNIRTASCNVDCERSGFFGNKSYCRYVWALLSNERRRLERERQKKGRSVSRPNSELRNECMELARCGVNGATYMRNLQRTNRFQSELRSQIPTTCLWASGDYQMKLQSREKASCVPSSENWNYWDSTDDSKDKRFTCSSNKEKEAWPEVLVESCSSSETFLTGRASGRLDLDLQFPRFLTDSEG
ncbi:hypothetical protein EAG_12335 [Camponotus floridanus]|uniref:Uncharacterized protein n=1 Tax=Camponotus floridanus TaxID=104421 RepID=E2B0E0_CAMFO|nr:hypothetical protein EAG_12335 [Camponotus floridanus]